MRARSDSPFRLALLAALGIGALAIACSLNPQPLPPYTETDASPTMNPGGDDAGAGNAPDSGNLAADSGASDASPPQTDAAADAPSDAPEDGDADAAPSDASDDGGG